MSRIKFAALALAALFAAPRYAAAQSGPKVFTGDHYAITFTALWDTVINRSVLIKTLGFGGMATMAANPSTTLPNIDSLTVAFSDSLGGQIKKDSAGVKTIGKYQVHWQKFTYDSLPKLSSSISKAAGFPVSLKNGSFRVYYLVSDGVAFSIAGMAIIAGGTGTPPYPDIESALATLKLSAEIGIIPLGRSFARDLWVKDGKLGGAWLKANRVFAVECYDSRGAFLGNATHAAEGAWTLPSAHQEMLVRLKTAQGTGMHFLVRP